MKILDLRVQAVTVEELLHIASSDPVRILADDGREFVLESADEFDQEVARLGQSEKFMQFLAERSKEQGSVTIEQLKRDLDQQTQ